MLGHEQPVTGDIDMPLHRFFPPPWSWVGLVYIIVLSGMMFACGAFVGASSCKGTMYAQIWPIPYLLALKTIAFDYPMTNAFLANLTGFDVGSAARALCVSLACAVFLLKRSHFDNGFRWQKFPICSQFTSDHDFASLSSSFPCTSLLVQRPFSGQPQFV